MAAAAHSDIGSRARGAIDLHLDADAERLQRVTNAVFDVVKLSLEISPLCQKEAHLVTRLAVDERRLEPAGEDDMGQSKRVGRVHFVALRWHRRAHVMCLQHTAGRETMIAGILLCSLLPAGS